MPYDKTAKIGEVVKRHPDAAKVIEKYFGKGCFTCPGIKMENLGFGAMMHNIDVNVLLKELNALVPA